MKRIVAIYYAHLQQSGNICFCWSLHTTLAQHLLELGLPALCDFYFLDPTEAMQVFFFKKKQPFEAGACYWADCSELFKDYHLHVA